MCEFKVYVNGMEMFKDIVEVSYFGDKLILTDILGERRELDSSMVVKVSVQNETLEISKNPLIGAVLRFLGRCEEVRRRGVYNVDVEKALEDIKAIGDNMVRDLWKTYFKKH
ncbi:MAG: hypothetical protein DRJ31_00130 [Candidatus Methanomethylicota archaeon]|uniref:CooT family nickel-binding protein n=1 Tax=Thermoproteota archaeon TaxID=2056631 RepID=A0A497ETN2_9CREN|nr:MAG: hypothetical protein DRJ31_00130 [Candidatus Verstraetearchaeota archaeon]RLE53620.1 MAG: hypothetical protein DRJ33_00485 [Candidatus Verstraetearchaeota archaeon]